VSGIDMPDLTNLPAGAPRVGFCRQACWSAGEASMHEKLELAASTLGRKGAKVDEFVLGNEFDAIYDDHAVIIDFEVGRALAYEYQNHRAKLSAAIVEKIETGWGYSRDRYDRALANAARYRLLLAERFVGFDFILTPAAPGEAPEGIGSTGSSIFSWIWSLFGVPCVTVPAYHGPKGLPIGVQIVGPYRSDTQTLQWAEWVRRAL
jgi:Asp-tRNA(Asn)/Glu-tRNA(Gln) amidotransferase A subunit family amidase